MEPSNTDAIRKEMLPEMLPELAAVIAGGEPFWTTIQMMLEFETLGFAAPFVVVRRREDRVKGSLKFTHQPRYYYGFEPHEG